MAHRSVRLRLTLAVGAARQGWEVPAGLTAVHRYANLMEARDSWKNTYYSPELVSAWGGCKSPRVLQRSGCKGWVQGPGAR